MKHKVLFVDDDINILLALKRQLRKMFHIEVASDPMAALETVARKGPYAVVVSDYRMPSMDGNQFLTRVRKIAPRSVRMLLTGHADLQTAMNAINQGNVFRLMTKPCSPEILADALTQGIAQYLHNSNAPGAFDREDFTGRPKRVLVVDDDPGLREMLADVMTAACDGLEVVTAENGREAAGKLGSARVDLVLTDLRMPDVNGLKLLAYMQKHYSGIPAIVMTGVGTPEIERRIESCNNYRYFEKPLDISLLMDVVVRELASRPLIQIHGISISALLQLIDAEKKSCTLKVMSGDRTGYLFFAKGTLIAAETADQNAEEAACAIISWERTVMEIDHFCPRKTREIHQPLMRVLMESARVKDEMAERANA